MTTDDIDKSSLGAVEVGWECAVVDSREKGGRETGNSQLRQLSGNFIARERRE